MGTCWGVPPPAAHSGRIFEDYLSGSVFSRTPHSSTVPTIQVDNGAWSHSLHLKIAEWLTAVTLDFRSLEHMKGKWQA